MNPQQTGTKAAAHYKLTVEAGKSVVVRLRLSNSELKGNTAFADFDQTFALRQRDLEVALTRVERQIQARLRAGQPQAVAPQKAA